MKTESAIKEVRQLLLRRLEREVLSPASWTDNRGQIAFASALSTLDWVLGAGELPECLRVVNITEGK